MVSKKPTNQVASGIPLIAGMKLLLLHSDYWTLNWFRLTKSLLKCSCRMLWNSIASKSPWVLWLVFYWKSCLLIQSTEVCTQSEMTLTFILVTTWLIHPKVQRVSAPTWTMGSGSDTAVSTGRRIFWSHCLFKVLVSLLYSFVLFGLTVPRTWLHGTMWWTITRISVRHSPR